MNKRDAIKRYEALPSDTATLVDRVAATWKTEGKESAQTFFDQLSHEKQWKRWEVIALASLVCWKAFDA